LLPDTQQKSNKKAIGIHADALLGLRDACIDAYCAFNQLATVFVRHCLRLTLEIAA
jgi:hypothetical protein